MPATAGPSGPSGSAADDWRRQRAAAAARPPRDRDRQRAREGGAGPGVRAAGGARARDRGLAPEPLRARAFDGTATYRTPLRGWYLRRNHSVAVGEDGEFYVLSVPGGVRARLRGVAVEPSDPPLVLGKGGRDGESIDLADALALVLDGR